MAKLGIITGSGTYVLDPLQDAKSFGPTPQSYTAAKLFGHDIVHVARHGKNHEYLSHQIPHNRHMEVLARSHVDAIIATTVVGSLHDDKKLGVPIVFDDFFFPVNMFDNSVATRYKTVNDKQRGHLLNPGFDSDLKKQVSTLFDKVDSGVYVHQMGPRFSTDAEAKFYAQFGTYVSQTAGPEIVLAGEYDIPYVLIGVAIDYATPTKKHKATPQAISENLEASKAIFQKAITHFVKNFTPVKNKNVNYRF